ncbi:hypothetical protein FOA52_013487 [Chlamydomonas sp. UWO 241]|nr:hypothetical protein FOA52_013487 [Chlamydomonas sp. UWO 241]
MFQHIYNKRRRVTWAYGPVTSYALSLNEIDTLQASATRGRSPSAIEIMVRKRHLAILADPLVKTLISTKWERFARAHFAVHAALYAALVVMQALYRHAFKRSNRGYVAPLYPIPGEDFVGGEVKNSAGPPGTRSRIVSALKSFVAGSRDSRPTAERRSRAVSGPGTGGGGGVGGVIMRSNTGSISGGNTGIIRSNTGGMDGVSGGGGGLGGGGARRGARPVAEASEPPALPRAPPAGAAAAAAAAGAATAAAAAAAAARTTAVGASALGDPRGSGGGAWAQRGRRSAGAFGGGAHAGGGDSTSEGSDWSDGGDDDEHGSGGGEGSWLDVERPGRSASGAPWAATTARGGGGGGGGTSAKYHGPGPVAEADEEGGEESPAPPTATNSLEAGTRSSFRVATGSFGALAAAAASGGAMLDAETSPPMLSPRGYRGPGPVDDGGDGGDGRGMPEAGAVSTSVTFADVGDGESSGSSSRSSRLGAPPASARSLGASGAASRHGTARTSAEFGLEPPVASGAFGAHGSSNEFSAGGAAGVGGVTAAGGGYDNAGYPLLDDEDGDAGDDSGGGRSGMSNYQPDFVSVGVVAGRGNVGGVVRGFGGGGGGGGGGAGPPPVLPPALAVALARSATATPPVTSMLAPKGQPAVLDRQTTDMSEGPHQMSRLSAAGVVVRTAAGDRDRATAALSPARLSFVGSIDSEIHSEDGFKNRRRGGTDGKRRTARSQSEDLEQDDRSETRTSATHGRRQSLGSRLTTVTRALRGYGRTQASDPITLVVMFHLVATVVHFITWAASYGGTGGAGPSSMRVQEFDDVLLSLVCLTGWGAMVYFARGLRGVGHLQVLLEYCVWQLLKFILLFILADVGFALAFFTVLNGTTKVTGTLPTRSTYGEDDPMAHGIGFTMAQLVRFMYGEASFEAYTESPSRAKQAFATIYFLVYVAVVLLLLTNLLTAMVIQVWLKRTEEALNVWRLRWTSYVMRTEARMPWALARRYRLGEPAYDVVLRQRVFNHVFEVVEDVNNAKEAEAQARALEVALEKLRGEKRAL